MTTTSFTELSPTVQADTTEFIDNQVELFMDGIRLDNPDYTPEQLAAAEDRLRNSFTKESPLDSALLAFYQDLEDLHSS